MFDKEYSFKGKHADMVEKLTGSFSIANADGTTQNKHKLFERNFDVYLLAPIIGFLYRRTAEIDTSSSNNTKVFADIQMKNIDDLKFNYRLIMLLDTNNEPNAEIRIEKAFRGIENKDDEALYDKYVLGGVEVLHEKIFSEANTTEDIINKLYDFLEEFNDRYNDDIDMDRVLELARKSTL